MNTILWRRLDLPGHEAASLSRRDDGWEVSGAALFAHEGRPCRLDYVVACDPGWRTRSAAVKGTLGDRSVTLDVTVDEALRWRSNGSECPAVEGCVDIDLGFSPSTNLLPIRRLSLGVGEGASVTAAWLPFPGLVFEPLPQAYRREGETTYRYESRAAHSCGRSRCTSPGSCCGTRASGKPKPCGRVGWPPRPGPDRTAGRPRGPSHSTRYPSPSRRPISRREEEWGSSS